MKSTIVYFSLLLSAASASPLKRQSGSGTGPYKAVYTTDPSLPSHTIYKPQNVDSVDGTLPVIAWGNGGCSANGLDQQKFNLELASHGFIVVASGAPGGSGSTTAKWMTDSIDWAVNNAGTGAWAKMDGKKIAAAGFSCGGLEAYVQAQDSRVSALGIFNSGQFSASDTNKVVPPIRKPVFYFLGGPSDIAYENGMRDYAALSPGVPSWNGNLPVGHGATYGEANGGKFAKAGAQYFKWVLKGDQSASTYFTGEGAKSDGWTVQSKDLNAI